MNNLSRHKQKLQELYDALSYSDFGTDEDLLALGEVISAIPSGEDGPEGSANDPDMVRPLEIGTAVLVTPSASDALRYGLENQFMATVRWDGGLSIVVDDADGFTYELKPESVST